MVLEFKNCCFCIELRRGTLLIAYTSLAANVITLILGFFGMIHIFDKKEEIEAEIGKKVSLPILFIGMAVIMMNILFLIVFLYGMFKYKREYVKVYLIYTLISIVSGALLFLYALILAPETVGVVSEIFSILLSVYFLLVVRSYYLTMAPRPPRPLTHDGNQEDQFIPPIENIPQNTAPTFHQVKDVNTSASRPSSPRQ